MLQPKEVGPRSVSSCPRHPQDNIESALALRYASPSEARPSFCRCSCHRSTFTRSPMWLQPAIGAASFRRKNLTWYGTRSPCSIPRCCFASGSTFSVDINYYPPRWLAARAILVSVTWNTLTNAGASLWIRVPRIVLVPYLHEMLSSDNIEGTLTRMGVLPTDMTASGNTLLTVRVAILCWSHTRPANQRSLQ